MGKKQNQTQATSVIEKKEYFIPQFLETALEPYPNELGNYAAWWVDCHIGEHGGYEELRAVQSAINSAGRVGGNNAFLLASQTYVDLFLAPFIKKHNLPQTVRTEASRVFNSANAAILRARLNAEKQNAQTAQDITAQDTLKKKGCWILAKAIVAKGIAFDVPKRRFEMHAAEVASQLKTRGLWDAFLEFFTALDAETQVAYIKITFLRQENADQIVATIQADIS